MNRPAAPNPAPRSASELASLAAAGDAAATAALLRVLAPEMRRVVRGVLGPYDKDSEDALQQALVALVHAMPAFRGECAPAGYACRIAFRTALAIRKSEQRAWLHRDTSAEMELIADEDGANTLAAVRERTEIVRNLLSEIPQEQAEALALRTMLGWSIDEIAQASGAPINTVRSRLRLAKEALRKKIVANPHLAEQLGVQP